MIATRNDDYHGFIGLNTTVEGFDERVMQPEQVMALFAGKAMHDAVWAFPESVAGAFEIPPVFFGKTNKNTPGLLNLCAYITENEHPSGCLGKIASIFTPARFFAIDNLTSAPDLALGFGPGTLRVNTVTCLYPDGKEAAVAHALFAVKNRAALFLRIKHPDGSFIPGVTMFFPDQPHELSHFPVKYGEAFILVNRGTVLTPELKKIVNDDFNLLVKKSYGEDASQLFSTDTQKPITDELKPALQNA